MPTEFFAVAESGSVAFSSHAVTGAYLDASDLVDAIADVLASAGWERIEARSPYAWSPLFCYGAVMGEADPGSSLPADQREPTSCNAPLLYVDGDCPLRSPRSNAVGIVPFNPYRQLPAIGCPSFPLGVTDQETFDSLVDKIRDESPFTGTTSVPGEARYGKYRYKLRSNDRGTLQNGYCFTGDAIGARTVVEAAWGGGWTLRSQTHRGSYIEVMIQAVGAGWDRQKVLLTLAANSTITPPDDAYPRYDSWPVAPGQEITYLTTHITHRYSIWACPYQFAVWAADVDGDTGGNDGSTSVLASIPSAADTKGPARVVMAPAYYRPFNTRGSSLRSAMTWSPALVSTGSALAQAGNNAGIAGMRVTADLLTPQAKPMMENPWVWGAPTGETARIIGQLWDGVLLSSAAEPRDAVMEFAGRNYVCMSKQPGSGNKTPGSLWLLQS